MNYNDQILENKAFNFFKQLMYNIALAICIMLLGVLILVYGFKFRLYHVDSGSQAPVYFEGDMVVVKAQEKYEVGDIIKFDTSPTGTVPTTHRLIYIYEEGGKTYYLCHGDAVQNADGSEGNLEWKDDEAFVKNLIEEEGFNLSQVLNECGAVVQAPTINQIEGKVVAHFSNMGTLFMFVKEHAALFIALVVGIWCFSSTIQNEIEIKRNLRLL